MSGSRKGNQSGGRAMPPSKRPSTFKPKKKTLKEEKFVYKVPEGYENITPKVVEEKKEVGNYVEELETRLNNTGERSWQGIDKLMTAIAKKHNISPKKLHDDFKAKNDLIPDEWVKRNDPPVVEDLRSPMEKLAERIPVPVKKELNESIMIDNTRVDQLEKAVTGLRTIISNNSGGGEVNLNRLDDVRIQDGELQEGSALVWSDDYDKWVIGSPVPDTIDLGTSDLGDLGDVDTTGAITGSALLYDAPSEMWIVGTAGGPAGPQGDPGPTGATGPAGPQGDGFTGGSYNPTTGIVTFTSDDGLGFSTTDIRGADGTDGVNGLDGAQGPQGEGFTGGSYNAGTGIVTFTSDDGLGFSTTDLRGADGAAGATGPQGPQGDGFTGGAYNSGTGIVTFTSNDGLGFSTTDLRGTNGVDGADGADGATGPAGPQGDGYTGGSYNSATGIVTFTSDDGLGFTTGDLRGDDGNDGATGPQGPQGDGFTGGSYSAATGQVTFTSDDGLGFTTGDLRGADGAAGATGPAGDAGPAGETGPAGPQGDGFTGGSYNSSTGIVTFTSDDGLGFSTTDIRGADGAPGADGNDGAAGATGPTGPGVQTGGTTGQILVKASNTDYDTTWTSAPPADISSSSIDQLNDVDTSTTTPTNGQVLIWNSTDSEWQPGDAAADAPVDSVNSQTGVVVLDADDIDDTSTTHKFATASQLSAADSAVQPGDLATVATSGSYNDLSDTPTIPPTAPVDSVNTQTGAVVLDADDIDDTSTTHKFVTSAQITSIGTAVQPGDNITTLTNNAGYLTSALQPGDNVSDLTNDAGYVTNALQPGDNITSLNNNAGYVTTSGNTTIGTDTDINVTGSNVIRELNLTDGVVTGFSTGNITASDIGAATSAQGSLADTAVQPGDDITTLTNNAGYLTSANQTIGLTDSYALSGDLVIRNLSLTQGVITSLTTGNITASDIGALQPGDNVSTLTNDAGYLVAGSVDAATLDGLDSSQFLRSDVNAVKTSGNLQFNDNVQAQFGTDRDFEIYHNSSHAYLYNGTGDVYFTNTADNRDIIISADNGSGSNAAYFRADGSSGEVILYHYGTQKFATKSTGISVTGDITVSGTVDGRDVAADGALAASALQPGDNVSDLTNDAGYLTNADGGNAATLDGLDSTSFLRSDASTVKTAGPLTFNDNIQLIFGTGSDLRIYHNSANSYITNSTGSLYISTQTDNERVHIQCDNGTGGTTDYFQASGSTGEARLYHYGTEKLATKSTGIEVTGAYTGNITVVSGSSVDCSSGNYFTKTVSANTTFTFTNVPTSISYAFTLEVDHNSGTISWPSSVKWPGDTAPTLTTGKTHLFMFVTKNGGSRWRGSSLVDYTD